MRLFVSIDLPEAMADAVARVQERLADAGGLRFTDPTQTHVTLKFLGETPEDELGALDAALERAVASADVGAFEAEFGGLGVFPSLEYIAVVWIGVREGGEAMTELHRAIEAETTAIGFDPEDHDFTPHATVARMSHAGGKELVQRVVREEDPTIGRTTVEEVRLTESRLDDDGPRYHILERYPLGD